jgi:hypothetical protein
MGRLSEKGIHVRLHTFLVFIGPVSAGLLLGFVLGWEDRLPFAGLYCLSDTRLEL